MNESFGTWNGICNLITKPLQVDGNLHKFNRKKHVIPSIFVHFVWYICDPRVLFATWLTSLTLFLSFSFTHSLTLTLCMCVCVCDQVDFLDTAGDLQFPAMRRLSITNAQAFVLVYSVSDPNSFDIVKSIFEEIREIRSDFQVSTYTTHFTQV